MVVDFCSLLFRLHVYYLLEKTRRLGVHIFSALFVATKFRLKKGFVGYWGSL